MTNIAIGVGKKKSYFIIKQDGKIIKESSVNTDGESFSSLLAGCPGSNVVMGAR